MFIQGHIDTRSAPSDKDLIEAEIGPIHRSFAGNQLSPFRAIIGMIRNYWSAGVGGAYSSSIIITNPTDVDLVVPWIRSDNSEWEDLDAEMMVIGAPDFVQSRRALPRGIVNTGIIGIPNATASSSAPEWTFAGITNYYEELLAIKESEIRKLSIELSQIKKGDLQHNYECEQDREPIQRSNHQNTRSPTSNVQRKCERTTIYYHVQ